MNAETKRHIDSARQILVGVVPNPSTQIDQITNALIYKFMDDMDQSVIKIGGKPTFFTGDLEKYAWVRIMDSRIGSQERMNFYSEALIKFSTAKQLPQLFRDIFKQAILPYRSPEVLDLFLKEINYFDYSHSEELGNAFEYLLSIMGSQGDAGQFRTPRHIIEFIVDVVNPTKDDKVLDPACGTAGFLISAYKHILEQHDGKDDPNKKEIPLTPEQKKVLTNNFIGYDISPEMVRLSRVNMYLHNFKDPQIVAYNTLADEERWNDKFDVILANPPFMSPKGAGKPHSKFSVQSSRSEVLFVDYIMNHLRPKGRAGIIVPEGIIFQSGKSHKELRKNLMNDGLFAVVSLPSGVFNPYAGVKTSILLFDNELAKQSSDILFIKVLNDGFDLGAQRRPNDRNDLPHASKILKAQEIAIQKENANSLLQEDSRFAWTVKKEEIAKNGDYNLSGDRYRITTDYSNAKWPMVKLGEVVVDMKDGGTPSRSKSEYFGGNVNWAVVKDIEPEIYNTKERLTEAGLKNSSAKVWPIDSIIISLGATIGNVGIAKVPVATKQGLSGIIVNRERILSKYLYYILVGQKEFIQSQATGASIKEVRPSKLREILIFPLPPLEIQEQIVAELESIDEEIKFNEKETYSLKKLQDRIISDIWHKIDKNTKEIPFVDKTEIISNMQTVSKLLVYMRKNQNDPTFIYFFESAILSLREIAYLFEKYFLDELDNTTKDKIRQITKVRNAICHRSSPLNYWGIEKQIKFIRNIAKGKCTLMKMGKDELKSEFDDDVAVFYGKIRIYLKRDAIYLIEKFNKIINDSAKKS